MKSQSSILLAPILALLLSNCEPSPTSPKGLVLPEGDFDRGKSLFVAHRCHRCHTVAGIELPPYVGPISERKWEPPLALGGEIIRVKTYGELVTAIINPDHVITPKYKAFLEQEGWVVAGDSPMPNDFAAKITVKDLSDLVTFLHTTYVKREPEYRYYEYYP